MPLHAAGCYDASPPPHVGVGVIHLGPTNDKPGDPIPMIYHDYTAETYIIPTGVGHGWSQVTDHVTYLSVRPDPDRVLPAGYVYPLLLKNQPTTAK